ncbi:hypothetical protein SK066_17910 [Paenibacillus hunanensis]|uniref:hypothetical protein n=1 Tax=Paenibacillus hunanensis TaxID=539262 RepID=UPI002A6AEC06|nr:hypothetical protein [Paenibacillus hunanensis]WPP40459.1 hypothetical protein SK066_17910 [Paenibacillus hunanensis]
MRSELPATTPSGSERTWSTYVRRAWLFDSTIVSLLVGLFGAIYLNFALQQTMVLETVSLREQLMLFLLFFIPIVSYGLIVLAPLNSWIRSNIRRVLLQFLLFNIAALLLTRIVMSALPLPDAFESPMVLWCIPIFGMISYLYSSLFLSQAPAAV